MCAHEFNWAFFNFSAFVILIVVFCVFLLWLMSSSSLLVFSVCLIFSPNFFYALLISNKFITNETINNQPTNTNIKHNNAITISLTNSLFVSNLFRIVLANFITQLYVVVIVVIVVTYCLCSNKCVCLYVCEWLWTCVYCVHVRQRTCYFANVWIQTNSLVSIDIITFQKLRDAFNPWMRTALICYTCIAPAHNHTPFDIVHWGIICTISTTSHI